MTPADLLARLKANDAVPGTVEVPAGAGPWSVGFGGWWSRARAYGIGGGAGGFMGGQIGVSIGVAVAAGAGAAIGLATGAVLGAGMGAGAAWWLGRRGTAARTARVLALAPEGCIVGLPDGVAVFGWDELAPITIATRSIRYHGAAHDDAHLVYRTKEGNDLGAIHYSWFAQPLELIVQVAEAYRRTFTASV